MITVQTYLAKPNVNRPGYVGYEQMNEYFLAINHEENKELVRRTFKRNDNFLGCILITYGEQVVMDDELIERLPLYWVIWVDLIYDYLMMPDETKEVSRDQYFSLKKTEDSHIIFNYYDHYVCKAPEAQLLKSVLLAAKHFFDMYHEYSMDPAYISTSEKVDTLLSIVTEQIQMNGL